MTRLAPFALAALIAWPALAQTMPPTYSQQVEIDIAGHVFPDPALTPGAVASTDVAEVCAWQGGMSYSQRHRATTPEMKREVRRRYGLTGFWRGEIDHLVPLCLGGADTLDNLWPQTDFKAKDELEADTCRAVCSGAMTLQAGQAIFLGDWRPYLQGAKP